MIPSHLLGKFHGKPVLAHFLESKIILKIFSKIKVSICHKIDSLTQTQCHRKIFSSKIKWSQKIL